MAQDSSPARRAYLERAAIQAADDACNLLASGERMALDSGFYQSRGELLRSGEDLSELNQSTSEVRKSAISLGCANPIVAQAMTTVRDSFRQFQKIDQLDFPGARGVWNVNRSGEEDWLIQYFDVDAGYILGWRKSASDGEAHFAIGIYDLVEPPAFVELVLRDPALLGDSWIATGLTGQFTPAKGQVRVQAKADSRSSTEGFLIFFLPPEAEALMEGQDPREDVLVRAGATTVSFEVGDYLAALNFARIPAQ